MSKEENGLRKFLWKVTAALVVVGVMQTVALAYWCGTVTATLNGHDTRIERVEEDCCP